MKIGSLLQAALIALVGCGGGDDTDVNAATGTLCASYDGEERCATNLRATRSVDGGTVAFRLEADFARPFTCDGSDVAFENILVLAGTMPEGATAPHTGILSDFFMPALAPRAGNTTTCAPSTACQVPCLIEQDASNPLTGPVLMLQVFSPTTIEGTMTGAFTLREADCDTAGFGRLCASALGQKPIAFRFRAELSSGDP